MKQILLFPPGHFYSPLPSVAEVRQHEDRIFTSPDAIPGIDLNIGEQLRTFDELKRYYQELPFSEQRGENLYYFENEFFSYADAIVLYGMIRHLRPARIIEIGSGFSSRAIMDTNRIFFNGSIRHTIIDPYPDRFIASGKDNHTAHPCPMPRVDVMQMKLQDTDPDVFFNLERNDILFVDSTHVAKTGSDVNSLIFHVLPLLKKGVCMHFHDIMHPFEYPREWVYRGIAWNEAYLLRAFLQYNDHFKIIFFSTYLEQFYEERFRNEMPLCLRNRGGSIWIRKED